MSLDGHMILSTKGNEFFQAWLTFADEEENSQHSFEMIYDPQRAAISTEGQVKLRKKSIFKTPTIESEYSNLLKISKVWLLI